MQRRNITTYLFMERKIIALGTLMEKKHYFIILCRLPSPPLFSKVLLFVALLLYFFYSEIDSVDIVIIIVITIIAIIVIINIIIITSIIIMMIIIIIIICLCCCYCQYYYSYHPYPDQNTFKDNTRFDTRKNSPPQVCFPLLPSPVAPYLNPLGPLLLHTSCRGMSPRAAPTRANGLSITYTEAGGEESVWGY